MSGAPAAATCCALWIGGNLGPIAAGCLASFVRRGHRVVLYCYDLPKDVPAGVETADAASVVPSAKVFRHKDSGSYALFSDLFRYELQRAKLGMWIDCDLYCVRPIVTDAPYVFGWQWRGSVNGAVLRLPADSPVLDALLALFTQKTPVPPWLTKEETAHFLARRLAGDQFSLEDLPWGAAGPSALTYLLGEHRLFNYAAPTEVFYPVALDRGRLLLRASADIRRIITPRTLTIHLWNEILSKHLHQAERGSAIDRLRRQGTLFDERFLTDAQN